MISANTISTLQQILWFITFIIGAFFIYYMYQFKNLTHEQQSVFKDAPKYLSNYIINNK